MVSRLEDMLLRYNDGKARFRKRLFSYLDSRSLRALRLTSRVLHDLVDHYPEKTFEKLFLEAPWPEQHDTGSLKAVAPFCRILKVKVGHKIQHPEQQPRRVLEKQRPPNQQPAPGENRLTARERWRHIRKALALSSGSSKSSHATLSRGDGFPGVTPPSELSNQPSPTQSGTAAQFVWIGILSRCQDVREIVIETHGDPGWPGQTAVEDALVTLRVALECSKLSRLRAFRLTPIHAMGIIHLRWSGFGALGPAPANKYNAWQNLHTLDVQLHNPFQVQQKLSESQQVMFKKILHDYLRSFASTLKCLRFMWLDDDGPSPMILDLEPGLSGRREPIVWFALEEVWLGNIALPQRTITLLPERLMKPGIRFKTLKSIYKHSRTALDDDKAWVEILLEFAPHGIRREGMASEASSVYSQ
ncbi:hypothetical protein Q7P37_010020 [Cladosporium fusiforme]